MARNGEEMREELRLLFGSQALPRPEDELVRRAYREAMFNEIEVLRYLARGLTKKEIAGLMHLSPKTIESHSARVMDKLDIILIMSVNPGFGGQTFLRSALDKLSLARQRIEDSGCDIRLEVDGGVKLDNVSEIATAGADTFVAGSAIFEADDYTEVIAKMKASIKASV